ncbi:YxlC family protein [Paenibacillus sp. ATY16]|uniref:YxlC family protein n=1 Tax=Paenibacillus sp. ATY16 TaxID=1759312 RepID=UPI00200DB794|nr:YxlC family protein [Paenibacillus sp. ATY16]MCK9858667.1 YxlC family protein [Paenibacillus sp. ATY16]
MIKRISKKNKVKVKNFKQRMETENLESQEKIITILTESLNSWDASIELQVPHIIELEQLISDHKEKTKRRLWRDLILLWMLGILVIGSMMLIYDWNDNAFWFLQLLGVVGGLLFLRFVNRESREAKYKWTR